MFKHIKQFFAKSITTSEIDSLFNSATLSPYDRKRYREILDKLGGYQYISADIVSKTCAAQKLRLYRHIPTGQSNFSGKKKEIYVKHTSIPNYRLKYLQGEHELYHNNIMTKALGAQEGIVQILEHPSLDLLKFQNPYSNYWEFIYTLTMAMMFYGNSFTEMLRDGSGKPSELWYVPPQYMEIQQGKTTADFITNYKWGEQIGAKKDINPADMLGFKMPGIGDSRVYGTSKIQVCWKYLGLIDSSLAFQTSLMKNMGRPDMLLMAEKSAASSEELDRLGKQWNDHFYGSDQAGKLATVRGKVDVKVLERSVVDFDNDTALISAIAAAFGVPRYKVLNSSGSLISDDTVGQQDFLKETIDTYLSLIEEVLNENLLSEWDDSGELFFAFDPVVKEDKEFKLKRQIEYKKNGIYTANRILEQEGEELIEGGDELVISGNSNSNNTETTPNDDKSLSDELNTKIDTLSQIVRDNSLQEKVVAPVPQVVVNIGETETEVEEELNAETIKEIEETRQGIGLHEVDSVDELFKELEKDEQVEEPDEVVKEKSVLDNIMNSLEGENK